MQTKPQDVWSQERKWWQAEATAGATLEDGGLLPVTCVQEAIVEERGDELGPQNARSCWRVGARCA